MFPLQRIDLLILIQYLYAYFVPTVKPESPEDVTPTDVLANSCVLKWKPPKNDGGSPITSKFETIHLDFLFTFPV